MQVSYAVNHVKTAYPYLSTEFIVGKLWWSTFVSLERKYMFFEAPKAGSTTVKTLIHHIERLRKPLPLQTDFREAKRGMFIHDRTQFELPSLVDLDDAHQREILTSPEVFRFTVVRNPYTRLESAWKDKVRMCEPGFEALHYEIRGRPPDELIGNESPITFAEFIESVAKQDLTTCDAHWCLQNRHIFRKAFNFTHIGRLEELGTTIGLFCEHLRNLSTGIDEKIGESGTFGEHAATHLNSSGVSSHYTDPLAGAVAELYREDFDCFAYVADRETGEYSRSPPNQYSVPEEKYVIEIMERNLTITMLYNEIERLKRIIDRKP